MWTTHDGYTITMPRFRRRRLLRRLRSRARTEATLKPLLRTLSLIFGRARRQPGTPFPAPESYPVFKSRIGRRRLYIYTRAVGDRRVELMLMRSLGRP